MIYTRHTGSGNPASANYEVNEERLHESRDSQHGFISLLTSRPHDHFFGYPLEQRQKAKHLMEIGLRRMGTRGPV